MYSFQHATALSYEISHDTQSQSENKTLILAINLDAEDIRDEHIPSVFTFTPNEDPNRFYSM